MKWKVDCNEMESWLWKHRTEQKHLRVLQLNHAIPGKLCLYADRYPDSPKGENHYEIAGFKLLFFLVKLQHDSTVSGFLGVFFVLFGLVFF